MQPQPQADDELRRQLIAQLFAADRGRRADEPTLAAYILALKRMDTTRLARVVERMLAAIETDAEVYRVPSASHIWRVARELRFGSLSAHTPGGSQALGLAEPKYDGWDVNANNLLLAYLTNAMRANQCARYAPDSHGYPVHAGPLTAARTAVLAKWKGLWARDMREDRELYDGKRDGRKLWVDYMATAEREIDALIAAERVAA